MFKITASYMLAERALSDISPAAAPPPHPYVQNYLQLHLLEAPPPTSQKPKIKKDLRNPATGR